MTMLSFGPFRLDGSSLELWDTGHPVAIRPQPCRLLALLASRPGELVTRAEIAAVLWPDVHVRFDLGLNSCLKQIRAALRDPADRPRWIGTLPRRGYRFLGKVRREGRPATGGLKRLVVLPVRGTPPGDQHLLPLAAALHDELEMRLARINGLAIVAASSLPDAYASAPSLRALAGTDIDLVVDWRVHYAAPTVRVAAQLVDVADRTIVWADMFDGSIENGFSTHRSVSSAISEALRRALCVEADAARLAG
jgi:DNA-binding winged helix-turn-helix (wHTH) protein